MFIRFFQANSDASREDNKNWRDTMTGLFADNYWKSMKVYISTFESMISWKIVYRYYYMNGIDLTWYFNCKCYIYGLI